MNIHKVNRKIFAELTYTNHTGKKKKKKTRAFNEVFLGHGIRELRRVSANQLLFKTDLAARN